MKEPKNDPFTPEPVTYVMSALAKSFKPYYTRYAPQGNPKKHKETCAKNRAKRKKRKRNKR